MALLNLPRNLFVVCILFVGLFVSCGPEPTRVIIRQGSPQQFVLSGRGTIEDLTITGPSNKCIQAWKQDRLPAVEEYWRIEPSSETAVNRFSTESITYGKVPDGFRQTAP